MDESERKARQRAEDALARSLQRFEQVFQQTEAGLFLFDADDCFVRVNAAFARIFGYEPQEMEGQPGSLILPPEEVEANAQRLEALKRGETPQPREFGVIAKDGSYRYIRSSPARVLNIDGELLYLGTVIDITEQKRAEERLRAEKMALQTFLNTAATGLVRNSHDLRYLSVNPAYAQIVGLPVDQIVGRTLGEVLGAEALEKIRPYVNRVLAGEQVEYEAELPFAVSGLRWIHVVYTPDINAAGDVVGWIGSIHDVTQQKQAERKLRDGEHRLRLALDAARMVAWSYDPKTHKVEVTENASRVLGLPEGGTLERDDQGYALIHPDDVEGHRALVEQAIREGGDYVSEYRQMSPEGEIWLEERGQAIPEEVGNTTRLVGVTINVTERRAAQAALQESEERFRQLADNIIQLVWMADGTGWIFWYNHRWFDYTGTTLEQMQGWGWKSVHHPEHIERVTQRWQQHLKAGQAWEDTFPLRGVDGKYRWFLSRAFPIRNETGEVVRWFGTNTDVNEQMEFVQEREQHLEEVEGLNARLQRAMRETHHRIKNNLQIIAGLIELQIEDGGASVPVEELRRLEQHVCALSVIHDLLARSAKVNIEADELSIKAALEQLHQTLLPLMNGRRLTINVEDIRLPARQVVSLAVMVDELILNALKHGGGDMEVSLGKQDSQARLTFTDRGLGFPSSFHQGMAASTGLELLESVVRTDLQGTIAYQNRAEGGAQVVVTFPLEASIVKA